MRPSATFKDDDTSRSPKRTSTMGSAASPTTSRKGSTGDMDRLTSVEEEMEESDAPGRKRSMLGDLRRSNAGHGARGAAGGVSMKDRKQLADPADSAGRRLSTAGMELLGNVNQDLEALITAQAKAQREMRNSSTGCQDEAAEHRKTQKRKPWTNITYIPPSLRGASDLIDTTPCAERVDPFSREDFAPPLAEPTLRLPSKPRPPPSRGRAQRLEEQRRREEGEQQQEGEQQGVQGSQAEAGDVYTEIEDVLLMGEDNNKSIPVQILTHKQISDHAIVGRAMRIQWGKLTKELDDNDPSASKLQDIPLPLDGLPSPPPPKSPLQVVGTNAMKRKKGIEDAASRAFQTWQQPQGQTGVPEILKLDKPTPPVLQGWVQQGIRHNTVVPRTPCNLAVLPSKHATPANTPHPYPLPEGFSPLPASPLYSHPIAHLEDLKPGAQDRPSPSQSLIKPRTLQLPPDLELTPSKSSLKAPKPLRSHPRSRPDKSQSPDRSSDPHRELKPSSQWASTDTRSRSLDQPKHPKVPPQRALLDTRLSHDAVFLTQAPDSSEVLAGTALADSHGALQAVAVAGHSAWKERPQIEEAAAWGQQQQHQQQGMDQQWQGGKGQDQPQHNWQQGLGSSHQQHHHHKQHSFDNSSHQSLAGMSSLLQPTVERPSKWTQPVPPESLPNALHSNIPTTNPVMPAFSPSKTAKPQAFASTAHLSHPPNLDTGEGQPWVGPIGPATKVSPGAPSIQPHVMPHFLRKLIALQHPQKKAEQKQSHLPDDPFLPRLKDASPAEPERSSLSDSSPWMQRSFKDTYCAGQGLSHIPHLPEIRTCHSLDLAAPGDVQGPASKHGHAGRSLAPHHDQQQCYGRRERIPLAARAKGEVFYPELRPTRVAPGPAIYLGGFERKSSPVILLGPPDSPRCALGASRADDHSVNAFRADDHSTRSKPATRSARSPPKARLHQPLVLGKPRHLLFQHQQQVLEEQASKVYNAGVGPHVGYVPAEAAASEPQKHPASASPKPPALAGGRVDAEQAATKDSTWQPPEQDTGVASIEPLASCSSPQRPAKKKGPLPSKGQSASSVF
ncbi:hypothetical protein DUNSADRAFT_9165 [Dunaliella salina]|uniref:Uncharacterized protein n=1 Tax=Dunaliella salina TaxID=3046 RepID=A0ABQ7GI17_DUNSA|nr:hypothetical protein DUNSADRAFT_9165 [Dunaliella salina]|eukprot:KAF5834253.1 hypothetical protein DUNSADRAFT_9165 [Dunaliella salina]